MEVSMTDPNVVSSGLLKKGVAAALRRRLTGVRVPHTPVLRVGPGVSGTAIPGCVSSDRRSPYRPLGLTFPELETYNLKLKTLGLLP